MPKVPLAPSSKTSRITLLLCEYYENRALCQVRRFDNITDERHCPSLPLQEGRGALRLVQSGTLAEAGSPAPKVDCQGAPPSSSHNEPSFTSFADHSAQFLDRRIVGLPACHPPDHFDKGSAYHRVTAPVNVSLYRANRCE